MFGYPCLFALKKHSPIFTRNILFKCLGLPHVPKIECFGRFLFLKACKTSLFRAGSILPISVLSSLRFLPAQRNFVSKQSEGGRAVDGTRCTLSTSCVSKGNSVRHPFCLKTCGKQTSPKCCPSLPQSAVEARFAHVVLIKLFKNWAAGVPAWSTATGKEVKSTQRRIMEIQKFLS